MTPEEKQKMDSMFKELTKHEVEFLKEQGADQNEHGVFLYISENGNGRISLDLFLTSYKEWLIEHKIVKEL